MSFVNDSDKFTKRGYNYNSANIEKFCKKNNIIRSRTGESYYFTLKGQKYRVSTHTIDESNAGAFDDNGRQVRKLFHPDGERDDTIYIKAGKNKLIEIYKMLQKGKKLPEAYVVKKQMMSDEEKE